jgi:hypothetical protein
MFAWIAKWLWSLWWKLPDETKREAIKRFVDALEAAIRTYHKEAK